MAEEKSSQSNVPNYAETVEKWLKSRKWTQEDMDKILQDLDATQALKAMSNEQLARLLIDHVWAYMTPGPASHLVNEAIERLCPEINAIIAKEEGEEWP